MSSQSTVALLSAKMIDQSCQRAIDSLLAYAVKEKQFLVEQMLKPGRFLFFKWSIDEQRVRATIDDDWLWTPQGRENRESYIRVRRLQRLARAAILSDETKPRSRCPDIAVTVDDYDLIAPHFIDVCSEAIDSRDQSWADAKQE